MNVSLVRRAVAAGAVTALALVAADGAAPPTATRAGAGLTVHLSAFDRSGSRVVPAHVPAGIVPLTVVDDVKEPAGAFFARLHAGYSAARAMAIFTNPRSSAQALDRAAILVGGLQASAIGRSASGWLDLAPGRYVVIRGSAHLSGWQGFTVDPTPSAAVEPASTGTVVMRENAFDAPIVLPAGTLTLKVVNTDTDLHIALVAPLPKRLTAKHVEQLLLLPPAKQPAWVRSISFSGTAPLSLKQTMWMTLHLAPGYYALICPLPDAQGRPHFMMGMLKVFEVR